MSCSCLQYLQYKHRAVASCDSAALQSAAMLHCRYDGTMRLDTDHSYVHIELQL